MTRNAADMARRNKILNIPRTAGYTPPFVEEVDENGKREYIVKDSSGELQAIEEDYSTASLIATAIEAADLENLGRLKNKMGAGNMSSDALKAHSTVLDSLVRSCTYMELWDIFSSPEMKEKMREEESIRARYSEEVESPGRSLLMPQADSSTSMFIYGGLYAQELFDTALKFNEIDSRIRDSNRVFDNLFDDIPLEIVISTLNVSEIERSMLDIYEDVYCELLWKVGDDCSLISCTDALDFDDAGRIRGAKHPQAFDPALYY